MKVLHIVGGDLGKGAHRGAFWLHQGLTSIGLDSKILGFIPVSQTGPDIATLSRTAVGKARDLALQESDRLWTLPYRRKSRQAFNTGFLGRDVTCHPFFRQADVVNVHWLSNGVTSPRRIARFGKPTVITLRDMWPLTGGCHYALECEGYLHACGRCPQLGSRRSRDLSYHVLRAKKRYLSQNVHVVGTSEWISECARRSAVFANNVVVTIPNCVDTDSFHPMDKDAARSALGLPSDHHIILVGASSVHNFYKGWRLFVEAMIHLSSAPLCLVTFGNAAADPEDFGGLEVRNLGYLHDEASLRIAYSAADVFVAPSVQEAFGKTLAEAMACGTPVVAFDAAGPADVVAHKVTGYKARPYESRDLARGIDWVLADGRSSGMGKACRQRVQANFSKEVVARAYADLYGTVADTVC